ncbi:hypothetical protein VKT23_009312 [Stygiomarasmius scandens]|uniref:Cytochrome P450 n=1 Tax=Marasmiellus scandens TaxID=2682957 RepID=A0ABR1JKA0_9AGAR
MAMYNSTVLPITLTRLYDEHADLFSGTAIAISTAIFALASGYVYNSLKYPILYYTPFLGQLGFFSARHDFMDSSLRFALQAKASGSEGSGRGGVYKVKTVGYKVNVLYGEIGRKLFFADKSLSLYHGYLFLRGGFPTTSNLGEAVEPDNNHLKTRLLHFMNREYLSDMLPVIVKEVNQAADQWSKESNIDLFDKVYEFIFKLTARLLICTEIADDDELRKHVRTLYWNIEDAATSFTNLVSWIPTAQKRLAASSTMELSKILFGIIATRRNESRRENDPLQYQIDKGDSDAEIIQFIFKLLFAGSVNTAAISAWIIVYLTRNPDYMNRVLDELRAAANEVGGTGPLSERIQHLSIDAWENDMPVLERVSRETIRLVFAILALRRNVENDLYIDGTLIRRGEFLAYPIHDAHLNPNIFPDPETWNPDRWLDGKDKEFTYAFLGWGVSRFPCTGMRIAKIEMKVIVGVVISSFDMAVTDLHGNRVDETPKPNRNDWQHFMPLEPMRMDIKRTVK